MYPWAGLTSHQEPPWEQTLGQGSVKNERRDIEKLPLKSP
jgi:hypothetical protein